MRNGLIAAALLACGGFASAQVPAAGPLPKAPVVPAPPPNPYGAVPLPAPDAAPFTPPPVPPPPDAPPPSADDLFRPTQATSAYPNLCWGRAEYLIWAIKNGPPPPPLVTTGPATAANPAALSDPNTVVLFHDGPVDYHAFSGGRFAVGHWIDPCETCGAEFGGFFLTQRNVSFNSASDAGGSPVLGIPIVDAATGLETVNYASFPGRFAGSVQITSSARVWGLEGNFLKDWGETTLRLGDGPFPFGDLRTHWLAGFRYLTLEEEIDLTQPSLVLPGGGSDFNGAPVMPGDVETIHDHFGVRSQFYGGQLGVRSELDHGPFYAEFTGKIALGDSHESIHVNGSTTLVPAATGTPAVAVGGLLATPTNIGNTFRDRFAYVPEGGINLGWQPIPVVRLYVGYTFLYWNNVVRAADQIDRTVNLTQVPSSSTFGPLTGPARPTVPFRTSDFWVQGANFGVELRY